jgi:hypothetical protein
MLSCKLQARALYVRATKADSSHAASWVSLGKLEERQKRQDKARECYSKPLAVCAYSHLAAIGHADACNFKLI